METKFDLSIIKVAQEHASFKDFRIRDCVNVFLKAVQLDLDEIGFEGSDEVQLAIKALESAISDVEGPTLVHRDGRPLLLEVEDIETPFIDTTEYEQTPGQSLIEDDEEVIEKSVRVVPRPEVEDEFDDLLGLGFKPKVVNVDDELNDEFPE